MIDNEFGDVKMRKQLLKQILHLRLDLLVLEHREWTNSLQGICSVPYSKELVRRDRELAQIYEDRKQEILDQLNALND